MTPIEQFFEFVVSADFDIWVIAKFLILLGLILYFIFVILVFKEVEAMNKTLNGVFNLPIKLTAWLLLILSLAVFVFALFIL